MSQSNLKQRLGGDPTRAQLVADCVGLVDDQVKKKGGLTGVAIKGAYATIKRIKSGFVASTIDALLDDWLDKLQPYHDEWTAGGGDGSLAEFLSARSDAVAEDLLVVTDERAERSSHTTAKKAYHKMRGSAKKHVTEAVPSLAVIIDRHLAAIAT